MSESDDFVESEDDCMEKSTKFVKKEQIKIREKEKQEVLKTLSELKTFCLKPLDKEVHMKDYENIKRCVLNLKDKFCRKWVIKEDGCNVTYSGHSFRQENKLKKHYPSYLNMERILELLLEHLNKNQITPENLRKSNMKKGSNIPQSLSELFLIETDDPEVFIQIKACSLKRLWEYKNIETNEIPVDRPFYYFYVKLLKISQEIKENETANETANNEKLKYLKVGACESRKISIKSKRCYWGFNFNSDTCTSYPDWIEDMDEEERIEDFPLPKKLEESDTLCIHLIFGRKMGGYYINKSWHFMDIVGKKSIQPIKNNNIERLKNNCYHWLGDESRITFGDVYDNIHGFECDKSNTVLTYKEQIYKVDSLKNNILRCLDFYLPDENGEVEAFCFKSK